MLRAAYFGQELLSTFGTTIGEIALIPVTGGIFTVSLTYKPPQTEGPSEGEVEATTVLLWDRKTEGGFPGACERTGSRSDPRANHGTHVFSETKVLKQRVRDHLDPKRDLGHSDTPAKKKFSEAADKAFEEKPTEAEEQSVYIEIPSRQGTTTVLNPDGTVCEDCS